MWSTSISSTDFFSVLATIVEKVYDVATCRTPFDELISEFCQKDKTVEKNIFEESILKKTPTILKINNTCLFVQPIQNTQRNIL